MGLLAALVGALGPADRVRTTYSWPPETLPAGEPDRASVHAAPPHPPSSGDDSRRAHSLRAAGALPRRERPRHGARDRTLARSDVDGLALRVDRGRLLDVASARRLSPTSRLVPPGRGPGCAFDLRLGGRPLVARGGPRRLTLGRARADAERHRRSSRASTCAPRTTAVVERDDGPARDPPRSCSRSSPGSLAALAIAARAPPRRVRARAATGLAPVARARRARPLARTHPADGVVGAVLLGWWVLSPAFWDDGWILERVEQYSTLRRVLDLLQRLRHQPPARLLDRVGQHCWSTSPGRSSSCASPPSPCLAAGWLLCRWSSPASFRPETDFVGSPLWAMASAFLVGALAWGMTMRPEPIVALIVIAVHGVHGPLRGARLGGAARRDGPARPARADRAPLRRRRARPGPRCAPAAAPVDPRRGRPRPRRS